MSGTTGVFHPGGQTVAVSVTATSSTAVNINISTRDVVQYVACLNTGTVAVGVQFSTAGTAATLAIDGTPGSFVLPPLMTMPLVHRLASAQVVGGAVSLPKVCAIGAGAGPSLCYFTPIVMLS